MTKTAVDALGLVAISDAIGAFFAYLPNLVAALLLLVLGSAIGQVAGQTVAQSAETAGIEFAPALGRLVSGLILFVTAMMAIGQITDRHRDRTHCHRSGVEWGGLGCLDHQ